jgi:hypothetical protein
VLYPVRLPFKNSILANTIQGELGGANGNCSGVITDAGYNISDDATCGFSATGSRNSTNPMLDPSGLKNNGGSTQTVALDSESPAIDAIPLADCTDQNSSPIHTDQRGALRPDPGEVVCDIGAYEFQDFAGQANCVGRSNSALAQQYGSLSAAASAYGFSSVKALKAAVREVRGATLIIRPRQSSRPMHRRWQVSDHAVLIVDARIAIGRITHPIHVRKARSVPR